MSSTIRHWIKLCETTSLTEMPITGLNVRNMEKPGSFLPSDRKMLQTPKHIERIRKTFEYSEVNFNLYFINQPDIEYTPEPTEWHRENVFGVDQDHMTTSRYLDDFRRWAGENQPATFNAFFNTDVRTDPDAITVVYLSNANEVNSIPMTPWIIAHRFAHAVTDFPERLSSEVAEALGKLPSLSSMIWGNTKDGKLRGFALRNAMTMRSARTGKLQGDVREELIAQYIIQGDVTLALNIDTDPHLRNSVRSSLHRMERDINEAISELLAACVGKMFVEV